ALSSAEVLQLFPGLTMRQLQWWDERSIAPCVHEGHKRLYDAQQCEMVGIVYELRKANISQERLRRVLHAMKRHKSSAPWLVVFQSGAVQPAMHTYEAVQKLVKTEEFGLIIDVDEIRRTVRRACQWKM